MKSKFFSFLKNYYLLLSVLVFGTLSLILQYGANQKLAASIIIYILAGIFSLHLIVEMIKKIVIEHQFGVDLLALTSIIFVLFVDEEFYGVIVEGYWSSLLIMLMASSGQTLENFANKRAINELSILVNNSPTIVHLQTSDNNYDDTPIDSCKVGDIFLVKPNEIVPLDGKLLSKDTYFDTSSITGESTPLLIKENETVLSGYYNTNMSIIIKATKDSNNSQYQNIVKLVKESSNNTSRFVKMADKYSIPFTIISYLLAFLSWLIAYLTTDSLTTMEGLRKVSEVLVIASPCPLLLAVPIAFVAGKSKAASKGIIIKDSNAIENISKSHTFCFDKTGTLTKGKIRVIDTYLQDDENKDYILKLVKSIEIHSTHILGKAFNEHYKNIMTFPISNLIEIPGEYIKGSVDNHEVLIGRLKDDTINNKSLAITANIYMDNEYIGFILFEDEVRENGKETLSKLKDLGVTDIVLITGDKESNAKKIADELGINKYYASCLPKDKLDILEAIKSYDKYAVMVGDGVNDAPSLKCATVGIAMAKDNATVASESADVIILKDDIEKVYEALYISKHTLNIAKQASLIGMSLCLILMVIAMFGVIPSFFGALLQEVIDVISILYALRVLMIKIE